MAFISDRPRADHVGMGRGRMGLRVEFGEGNALARTGPLVARPGARVDLIAAEPFVDVADETRLAIFAIVDDIDAELGLPAHDLAHRVV